MISTLQIIFTSFFLEINIFYLRCSLCLKHVVLLNFFDLFSILAFFQYTQGLSRTESKSEVNLIKVEPG